MLFYLCYKVLIHHLKIFSFSQHVRIIAENFSFCKMGWSYVTSLFLSVQELLLFQYHFLIDACRPSLMNPISHELKYWNLSNVISASIRNSYCMLKIKHPHRFLICSENYACSYLLLYHCFNCYSFDFNISIRCG